jgi:glycosyltransferase involved in cell wall biosynthesis
VVATDSPGGTAEVLVQGALGRLVPVGDAQATAEAILEAIQSGQRPAVDAALVRHDIAAVSAAYEAALLGA